MKLHKHIRSLSLTILTSAGILGLSTPAHSGTDPFIGELMLFGGNFCPRNWAAAEGQLLAIASNTALFSIFGTQYGGDGRTTFGLPDLRGRAPIGAGSGPGLTNYVIGEKAGKEQQVILEQNMPPHNHDINATNTIADKGGPGGKYLAAMGNAGSAGPFVYSDAAPNRTMAPDAISNSGGGLPIDIRTPTMALSWCVALFGVFPSRN